MTVDDWLKLASVCFITDTGSCSGNSFNSGANTEDGGHGAPGSGSGDGDNSDGTDNGDNSGGTDDGKDPDYDLDNAERCKKEGYTLTSCSSVQNPANRCPYDTSYFEKCVCKPGLVTCAKPQYGVGEACGGKYASCQTDNPRACREDGYTNTCVSGQKLRKDRRCQYDNSYGICCTESCPQYTSVDGSYEDSGSDDGCGYACYYTCQMNCPTGTSETNPGGCGGSTSNGCGNKTCYNAYKSCCTPAGNERGCNCRSCSDGCGGTRTCCDVCYSIHNPWCEGSCGSYSGESCDTVIASYQNDGYECRYYGCNKGATIYSCYKSYPEGSYF